MPLCTPIDPGLLDSMLASVQLKKAMNSIKLT